MRLLKKILAGCLLSFGFIFLILGASSVWVKDAKERKDLFVGGLIFGVPPTVLGIWLVQGLRASSQQEQRDRLQSTFYHLLKQGNGRITPLAFAMATGLRGDAAKAYLDERAREFSANFDVDAEGNMAYRFDIGLALQSTTTAALPVATAHFDVILETVPDHRKIEAIKIIREFTQLGLKEAKDLVESAPIRMLQQVDQTTAQTCQQRLQAIDAIAMLIPVD